VDHHDPAYRWAERRRLETHPTTGAAQFVEIREQVREIPVPQYVASAPAASPARECRPRCSTNTWTPGRARDCPLVSGVEPASEFLDDMKA